VGNDEVAEALFAALASGADDAVRQLCAADMAATQNHGPVMSVDALLRFNSAVHRVVKDFRYEGAVRAATDNGFVEEHQVCGTLEDGSEMSLAACVVGQVQDTKITQLREYVDSRAAAGLLKALARE
jgi:ketosteroid isomerase-like protein